MAWVNTSPLVRRYTLEEFWDLPERPDYSKVELIAGVLYLTPRPDRFHGAVVSKLIRVLSGHQSTIRDKGKLYIPRAGIRSEPNTWLEPDFFYVSANSESQILGQYHKSADLVVEVISAESAIYARNTKADTYAALGEREIWLVDQLSGLIELRVLRDEAYVARVFDREDRVSSTVLPGLEFKVSDVFGD